MSEESTTKEVVENETNSKETKETKETEVVENETNSKETKETVEKTKVSKVKRKNKERRNK